jgi:uncharacterized Tic20 family protein
MGMLAHLLSIFLGFLGPLIIWLIKKDQSPYVNDQAKEALNFQITLVIVYIIGWLLALVLVGFFILAAAWILSIVFGIMGAAAASRHEPYRYPINIRFMS